MDNCWALLGWEPLCLEPSAWAAWFQGAGTFAAVIVSLFVTFWSLRHQVGIEKSKQKDMRLQNLTRLVWLTANIKYEIESLKNAVANNGGQKPRRALELTLNSVKEDYASMRKVMLQDLPNVYLLVLMSTVASEVRGFVFWLDSILDSGDEMGFECAMHRIVSRLSESPPVC